MSLNLGHFLDVSAREYGDKPAIVTETSRVSFNELARQARRVANLLRARGIQPGDKVAMMVSNVPQFTAIYYGILRAGAVVVPLNCLLRENEVAYMLEDSEAKGFFVWHNFAHAAGAAYAGSETCGCCFDVGTPSDAAPGAGLEPLEPALESVGDTADTVQTMPDDTAVILYTSGTTGHPKGAELTHFNMFFNALITKDRIIKVSDSDVGLVILPLFHSFGQTCLQNVCIMAGATMSLMQMFDAKKVLRTIERDKVTYIAAVPTMYFYLLNVRDAAQYDVSSLRLAVSGGAAMPVETFKLFEDTFNVRILEGYGLSETSPVASFNIEERPSKPGSIGLPVWGCDMRVQREDGSFADTGEVGEIVMRGHNVMKGYYRRPKATDEAFAGGWFHTGDMARVDEDGYFFVVDRKKDLIIRAGMNIYPRQIEEVLHGHPAVLEAAVVGVPDRVKGEDVKAYVALREGAQATEDELRAYCRERLAQYKWPRKVEVLDSLPKGPTGKILKRELRKRDAEA